MKEEQNISNRIAYVIATELYLKPLLGSDVISHDTLYQAGNALFERFAMQTVPNAYRPVKRERSRKPKQSMAAQYPEYMSLTEIAHKYSSSPGQMITGWLNKKQTREFIVLWEEKVGDPSTETNRKSIISKRGNQGGTFAAYEIACYFMLCHSPQFAMHLIETAGSQEVACCD